jgi:hypothetical protein
MYFYLGNYTRQFGVLLCPTEECKADEEKAYKQQEKPIRILTRYLQMGQIRKDQYLRTFVEETLQQYRQFMTEIGKPDNE